MLRAVASQVLAGTWASKPASAPAGTVYFASDVGEAGTLFMYGASRWRPVNGSANLKSLANEVTGITTTENLAIQTLIPAGTWQSKDTIRLWCAGGKSGTTDNARITVRIGTAGTTADTAITGLSTLVLAGAASTSWGLIFDVKLISATSAQKMGPNASSLGTYSGASSGAQAAATAITDASANALYVSMGFTSSGATDTVTVSAGQIQLITV